MPSKPRGIERGRLAFARLLTQASAIRAVLPIVSKCDAPIRVFALLLLFSAITAAQFLRDVFASLLRAIRSWIRKDIASLPGLTVKPRVPLQSLYDRSQASLKPGTRLRALGFSFIGGLLPVLAVSLLLWLMLFSTADEVHAQTQISCGRIYGSFKYTHPEIGPTSTIPGTVTVTWSIHRGVCITYVGGGGFRIKRLDSPRNVLATVTGFGGATTSVEFTDRLTSVDYCRVTGWSGTCRTNHYTYVGYYTTPFVPVRIEIPHLWAEWARSDGISTRVRIGGIREIEPRAVPIPLSVLEIVSTPAVHSTYAIGEVVRARAAFGEEVELLGEPSLQLAIGERQVGSTLIPDLRVAEYEEPSGEPSTITEMYFRYTVQEDDLDETGISIPENPVSAGVLKPDDPLLYAPVHVGLPSDPDHKVDGVRPRINNQQFDPSVFSSLKTADTGYKIDVLFSFDEDVEVTGDPQVAIRVNGSPATSTFSMPTGFTLNKSFRHIHPRSSDATETSTTTSIALPAGSIALDSNDSIRDRVGNDAVLAYGSLSASSMTAYDHTGVILEGLSIHEATNRYGWLRICKERTRGHNGLFRGCQRLNDRENGQGAADVRASFDEAITQSLQNAVLDVTLDGGATSTTEINLQSLVSDAAAGRIDFSYFVKAGEDAPGGISVAPGSLTCSGGGTSCYRDTNDNPAVSLTHTGLPLQPQYKIDGIVPTIEGLEMLSEAPGREGWYGINDTIRVGMRFSEPVLVGSYGRRGGGSQNVFIPNFGGDLKLPLTLDAATTTPTELLRYSGDIMAQVHDFRFIVREGDNDPTGISVAANSLDRTRMRAGSGNKQEAVIHDIAYNHLCEGGVSNWQIGLNPSGPLGGDYEECDGGQDRHTALAAQIDHKVDGTPPTLVSVQFANEPRDPDGYAIGELIDVTATFSERVWVTHGEPTLNLRVGDDLVAMVHEPHITETTVGTTTEQVITGTTTLRFYHIVEEGQQDTDGLSIPANAFNAMGAVIDDVARNPVSNIAHDAVDTDSTRKVDGIRATITASRFISMPSSTSSTGNTYTGGDEIAVELTFSEPVDTIPDGALMDLEFSMADSSTVTRQMQADGVTSTTTVVFRYTVTDQDLGTDVRVPENPFGRPISEILELLATTTSTTTRAELLLEAIPPSNIVDKVAFVDFISV